MAKKMDKKSGTNWPKNDDKCARSDTKWRKCAELTEIFGSCWLKLSY